MDVICDDLTWDNYLESKKKVVSKKELIELNDLISGRNYHNVVNSIVNDSFKFPPARRLEIPKPGTDEKRLIYTFKGVDPSIDLVLKLLARHLLLEFDSMLSDNLYSYRVCGGVQKAISRIRNMGSIGGMYAYKVDIRKYFNSVDVDIVLNILKKKVDYTSFKIIEQILRNPMVERDGELIEDNSKGIMPGLPISTFLSNIYLDTMDTYFQKKGI